MRIFITNLPCFKASQSIQLLHNVIYSSVLGIFLHRILCDCSMIMRPQDGAASLQHHSDLYFCYMGIFFKCFAFFFFNRRSLLNISLTEQQCLILNVILSFLSGLKVHVPTSRHMQWHAFPAGQIAVPLPFVPGHAPACMLWRTGKVPE